METIAQYLGTGQEVSLRACETILSTLRTIRNIPADAAELLEAIAGQKPGRILEAARSGVAWSVLRSSHGEIFVDAAWDTPAVPLSVPLSPGLSFFGRFGRSYRQGSKALATLIRVPLPQKASDRIALIDKLIAVEKARDVLETEHSAMGAMLPIHWRGEATDFATLQTVASAVHALSSLTPQPSIAAITEIVKRNLAADYIAEILRLRDKVSQSIELGAANLGRRCFQGISG